jgi:hypothetical protein
MYGLTNTIQAVHYCNTNYIIEKAMFFSDNTNARWFLNFCNKSRHYEIPLINKNYYFLDVQPALEKSFSKVIDEEDYIDIAKQTVYLLCDDVDICLKSLDAGNKPIFFMKKGKFIENIQAIHQKGIPVVSGKNLDELMKNFEVCIQNYEHKQYRTLLN